MKLKETFITIPLLVLSTAVAGQDVEVKEDLRNVLTWEEQAGLPTNDIPTYNMPTGENTEARKLEATLDSLLRNFSFSEQGNSGKKFGQIHLDGYEPIIFSKPGVQSGDAFYQVKADIKLRFIPKTVTPEITDIKPNNTGRSLILSAMGTEQKEHISYQKLKEHVLEKLLRLKGEEAYANKIITIPINDKDKDKKVYLEKKDHPEE